MIPGKFHGRARPDFGSRTHSMNISAPSRPDGRLAAIQPWTVGLVGVVAILVLLVALTI